MMNIALRSMLLLPGFVVALNACDLPPEEPNAQQQETKIEQNARELIVTTPGTLPTGPGSFLAIMKPPADGGFLRMTLDEAEWSCAPTLRSPGIYGCGSDTNTTIEVTVSSGAPLASPNTRLRITRELGNVTEIYDAVLANRPMYWFAGSYTRRTHFAQACQTSFCPPVNLIVGPLPFVGRAVTLPG